MRTINSVRAVKWANYDKTAIDVEVDFDELDEEYVWFTATPYDTEAHGVFLYEQALAGSYGPISDFVADYGIDGEAAQVELRRQRDEALAKSDYIEGATIWPTLNEAKQQEWATYRQALRDLPANSPNARWGFDERQEFRQWYGVNWPNKPSA